jgi:hypothetical protein
VGTVMNLHDNAKIISSSLRDRSYGVPLNMLISMKGFGMNYQDACVKIKFCLSIYVLVFSWERSLFFTVKSVHFEWQLVPKL